MIRFLTSKEHLSRNIARIENNHFKFKHKVEVMLHVKTESLWKGTRSYIWRHLGSDNTWKRGNGTTTNLVRIHDKGSLQYLLFEGLRRKKANFNIFKLKLSCIMFVNEL